MASRSRFFLPLGSQRTSHSSVHRKCFRPDGRRALIFLGSRPAVTSESGLADAEPAVALAKKVAIGAIFNDRLKPHEKGVGNVQNSYEHPTQSPEGSDSDLFVRIHTRGETQIFRFGHRRMRLSLTRRINR